MVIGSIIYVGGVGSYPTLLIMKCLESVRLRAFVGIEIPFAQLKFLILRSVFEWARALGVFNRFMAFWIIAILVFSFLFVFLLYTMHVIGFPFCLIKFYVIHQNKISYYLKKKKNHVGPLESRFRKKKPW